MMNFKTVNDQPLDDFFRPQIPQGLITPLTMKLKILKIHGRGCIGAFVFPVSDMFHFEVTDPNISEGIDVYISFVDVEIILIVKVLTFRQ